MSECDYTKNYTNVVTGDEIDFQCHKEAVNNSHRCIFHLDDYLNEETRDNVIQEFNRIISTAKDENPPEETVLIQCVGYILPSISLLDGDKEELSLSIDFSFAEFKEKIDFSNIHFKHTMSFYNTIFHESTSFTFSSFNENVFFSFAEFLSISNSFQYTSFKKSVNFTQATLTNARFKEAEFCDDALFSKTKFCDDTSFWNSRFLKDAIFKDSTFFDSVDFSESQFCSLGEFEGTTFTKHANFSKVSFEDKIKFNGNLSMVSFLDTDIKKIIFGNNSTWKVQDLDSKLNSTRKNTDFKIYDEKKLEESNEITINLESVKNVYRDLRDNFDQNLQYDTAGEFFVREMELNRKYEEKQQANRFITKKKFLFKRVIFSFYWWYNLIAQYGQSYYRPIYFALPILVVGMCVLLNESLSEGTTVGINLLYDGSLQTTLIRSLSAFIPLISFNHNVTSTDYVLRLLLLPISISFFIALKRKMERKLRH